MPTVLQPTKELVQRSDRVKVRGGPSAGVGHAGAQGGKGRGAS